MNEHWQSIAAIAVVSITLALFTLRAVKNRKKPGCGGGCGCGR